MTVVDSDDDVFVRLDGYRKPHPGQYH